MRKVVLGVLIGVALALGAVGQVRADDALTSAVAAAYFPRNVDGELHDIAHQRVAESSQCRCLDHDRMRSGTAEVLAWNEGSSAPISAALADWSASSLHRGILSDRSYGRIGCASLLSGGRYWFACVVASGPLPAGGGGITSADAPVMALPNTSLVPSPRSRPTLPGVIPI